MTSDHLYPLECECDSSMIHEFASTQARADVPDEIVDLIRDRENHRVAAVVREASLSPVTSSVVAATVPCQVALSTKAGCEWVLHVIQALADTDATTAAVRIDAVGAFSTIRRVPFNTPLGT